MKKKQLSQKKTPANIGLGRPGRLQSLTEEQKREQKARQRESFLQDAYRHLRVPARPVCCISERGIAESWPALFKDLKKIIYSLLDDHSLFQMRLVSKVRARVNVC
jgi:hypothetical protein